MHFTECNQCDITEYSQYSEYSEYIFVNTIFTISSQLKQINYLCAVVISAHRVQGILRDDH